MSQVEELLNSMAEVPVHTHPVPDTDTYFIIDPITRSIENTTRKKTIIMQYDHNSERFTFELPRFIDGHDMMNCTSVTVNVDNVEAETGTTNSDAPDMTDLRIHPNDPEKVISSWLITRNSTQLAGHLSFHIEYKCADSNGNVVYEWATDSYDEIQVKARKKNGEAAVIEHTDLLEQWRASIFGAGDSVMANIEAEGKTQVAAVKAESETQQEAVELKGANTLETIPEDYTNVNNMAEEAMRTKTDAIVLEAAGDSITLKDSSDDHIRGLKLFGKSSQVATTGKNLFNYTKSHFPKVLSGVTFTYDDGWVILNGTCTDSTNMKMGITELTAGSYTISANNPVHNNITQALVQVYNYTDAKGLAATDNKNDSYSVGVLTDGAYECRIRIEAGITYTNFKVKPQLEVGTVATEHENYSGGKSAPNPDYPQEIMSTENPIAHVCGKNLVDSSAVVRTVQANVTTDGNKICVKKTNTGNIYSNFYYRVGTWNELAGKTITVSIENTSDYVWHMHIGDLDNSNAWVADNALKSRAVGGHTKTTLTATIPNDINGSFVGLRFVSSDTIISDKTYILQNLQVEVGDTVTEYEPYRPIQSLATKHTLPGIPVTSGGSYTDSDGQQWICDEVDLERGVYVKRIGIKDFDGSDDEDWGGVSEVADNMRSWIAVHGACRPESDTANGIMCSQFNPQVSMNNGAFYQNRDRFFFGSGMTLNAWKAHLQSKPLQLVYILSTPIETPLTAEEITAFKALRTNRPNTTILNDAGAWMTAKYNADTLIFLRDNQPKPTDDQVTTAVNAYLAANGVQVPSDKHISDVVDSEIGTLKADLVSSVIAALPVYNGEVVAE